MYIYIYAQRMYKLLELTFENNYMYASIYICIYAYIHISSKVRSPIRFIWKFSKVSSIGIVYSKSSSEMTFEKSYLE